MIEIRRLAPEEGWADCHHIRREVFIVEQGVSEPEEMDDLDSECAQYAAYDDGIAVATARVLPVGDIAKIGRVAVMKSHRGTGLGAQIMRFVMEDVAADFSTAKLSAQVSAIGFYEALGFKAYGPEYPDAGIPHRDMKRDLP